MSSDASESEEEGQFEAAHLNDQSGILDDAQLVVPGKIYLKWTTDASGLVSKKIQVNLSSNAMYHHKISDLMEMPPVALMKEFKRRFLTKGKPRLLEKHLLPVAVDVVERGGSFQEIERLLMKN